MENWSWCSQHLQLTLKKKYDVILSFRTTTWTFASFLLCASQKRPDFEVSFPVPPFSLTVCLLRHIYVLIVYLKCSRTQLCLSVCMRCAVVSSRYSQWIVSFHLCYLCLTRLTDEQFCKECPNGIAETVILNLGYKHKQSCEWHNAAFLDTLPWTVNKDGWPSIHCRHLAIFAARACPVTGKSSRSIDRQAHTSATQSPPVEVVSTCSMSAKMALIWKTNTLIL